MPKVYQSLPTTHLWVDASYIHPHTLPEIVHENDPASSVMMDFHYTNPLTTILDMPIDSALMEMKACQVSVLLVINAEQKIVGLISSEEILGEKPVKLMREGRLKRTDILVRMVMTPQAEILVVDMEDLRLAKVGNIVQTLQETKCHHMLAVKKLDKGGAKQIVQGLFCLSQINKQMGFDVSGDMTAAHSLAELQHDLQRDD